MSVKEYLSQARYLDMRIQSKLEQLESLNELATKCTSVITGMPHSPSKSTSSMADTINKIIDLQYEINKKKKTLECVFLLYRFVMNAYFTSVRNT